MKTIAERFCALPEWAQEWICHYNDSYAYPGQGYWYRPYIPGGDLTLWSDGWHLEAVVETDQTELWYMQTPGRIDQAEAMASHWEEIQEQAKEKTTKHITKALHIEYDTIINDRCTLRPNVSLE